MPNQLASSKRRQSLAEHEAVLAALEAIARHENTTVMALLREGARHQINKRVASQRFLPSIRKAVESKAPRLPGRFKTAAEASRYKRTLREYDRVLIDLGLADRLEIQRQSSLATSGRSVRIVDFDVAHATLAR